MEPIANGLLMIFMMSAFIGVIVGALGGVLTWRLKGNLVLGALLTGCALFLALFAEFQGDLSWLGTELQSGAPSMILTFMLGSTLARWVGARTRFRRTWTAVAALVLTLVMGYLYLLLFRVNPELLPPVALGVSVCLVPLLLRRGSAQREPT